VLGEGAGVLVLEELEHAKKRGAVIYAEVLGLGSSFDAYAATKPDPEARGATRAIRSALKEARVDAADVDYINAHGTSTPLNDRVETLAIKNVFGPAAYELAVSSTKSMTGHMMGAAGALESLVCALVIRDNCIPPTINLEEPDLDYVPLTARPARVDVAMSNSIGLGGHNSCVILKRVEDA
jgi:3-oxoacyl-[acyl-carrier-protein] synthase II